MEKIAKHISFCSDTIDTYTHICISLKLLEIPYQGAIKSVANPTKRPHFLTTKWTIIVHNEDLETLKDIIELANPILKYEIKDGYFVERLQRRTPQSLNV